MGERLIEGDHLTEEGLIEVWLYNVCGWARD